MGSEETLRDVVGASVDELALCGVRHAVICPGSRSTPAAVLLQQHPGVRVWMHLDERSAAFFALGIARGLRQPVAVLCTSGTAAANMLPAVIEARYGRVPLIVLTADRPPELQDVGAPQTIAQVRLYGEHARWFAQLPVPEPGERAAREARALADRAVSTAVASPPGPVHLNLPFREPLIPAPYEPGSFRERPQVLMQDAPAAPDAGTIGEYADDLAEIERGLIVCGPQDDPDLPAAAVSLSQALGYPLLADPLSQCRCGEQADGVIDAYDAFLRDDRLAGSLRPDVVIRLGAIPTSKPLTTFLGAVGGRHILVDAAGWNDPLGVATDIVHADPVLWCRALAESSAPAGGHGSSWYCAWQDVQQTAADAISSFLSRIEEPFEGKVFSELASLLPAGATVFASSSMPVRDLDTFFPSLPIPLRFLANRGANGIDGVISTALGASISGPLVLVTGDLALYHDMNGLLAAKLHHLDATIILLNNDGGGIFSFLPQAGLPEFEALFGTPHGLDFRPGVEMYGGAFTQVATWPAFREAVRESLNAPGLSVIEVPTERERNVVLHREVWDAVAAALERSREVAV